MNLPDTLIISTYGAEYRGIVQYYLLASDVWRLNRLHWAAETSMLKTLAAKHGSTVTKMARKYKATISDTARAAHLLRGHRRTGRQETTGRQVRRHPAETAEQGGPHRPPASPGHPPQGTDHPAPGGPVRVVRATRPGGSPPGPQARRPHQAGTATARVGAAHGPDAQEDPHGLRPLPPGHPRRAADRSTHGVVTGEPRASKGARVVRTGGRWKRTRLGGHLASGLPV